MNPAPEENPVTRAIWRSYIIVCLLNILNYMDRMVLPSVVPAVRAEFSLSDTQIGMLFTAFAIVYAVCAVPIGRLADALPRKRLVIAAASLWSVMTVGCGLATSYWTLFIARMGVSLGECGYSPTAYSLFSDYFSPRRRNWTIGLFNSCSSIGVVCGLVCGGWLAAEYGWRSGFIILGLPGLLVALLMFGFLVEPVRGASDAGVKHHGAPGNLVADLKTLFGNRMFVWILFTTGFNGFCAVGMVNWLPSFFERSHQMSLSSVGLQFGIAFGVGLGLGQIVGGFLGAYLARLHVFRPLLICIASNILLAPVFLVVLWVPSAPVAIAVTLVAAFLGALGHPVQAVAAMNALPSHLRGMAAAIITTFFSFFGMAVGPLLVGILSDWFTAHGGGVHTLRNALSMMQFIFVLATFSAWRAYLAGRPQATAAA